MGAVIRMLRTAGTLLPLLAALAGCSSASQKKPPPAAVFVGYISESDCAEDHAPMLATGRMGKSDRECTLTCVRLGAAFGFVDAQSKTFYQLDDQEKPRPFAGQKVRVTGQREGDTLYVSTIEAAD